MWWPLTTPIVLTTPLTFNNVFVLVSVSQSIPRSPMFCQRTILPLLCVEAGFLFLHYSFPDSISVVFDPIPAMRELRVLYAQMDILLKQLKGLPSVANDKPVPDVLFQKLSSPIVGLQFIQGTLNLVEAHLYSSYHGSSRTLCCPGERKIHYLGMEHQNIPVEADDRNNHVHKCRHEGDLHGERP